MPYAEPGVLSALTCPAAVSRTASRKVVWRILPLMFVLYIIAYLDRVNVGAAKLAMTGALGFTEDVIGWGAGLFFAGYLLLEIPGALLVEHWSARKWFARILITWGLCSMATAFVRQPWQFYGARILLGLAEAGFFPGIIVYYTHWFPRAERTRALAGLVLAIPVCMGLGSEVSARLLDVRWFNLAGWQWLFLLEGLPAVLCGAAVPFLLTDRPRQAAWLTPAEKDWLITTLEIERREAVAVGGATLGTALRQPTVWLLALGIFVTNIGGYVLAVWLPTAVESFLKETNRPSTHADALMWTGLIFACGFVGVLISGQLSDRTGQRKWTCVAGQVLTGVCLAMSVLPGQSWAVMFAWLCGGGFFAVFWCSPFWVLPTLTLTASVAAVSIALINIAANLAGLIGLPLVGHLKTAGATDRDWVRLVAACYVVGGLIVASLRMPRRSKSGSLAKNMSEPEA